MSPELDKKLVEKYPKLFANRYGNVMETAMCWGFECGDGWYNILDVLCSNIQHHIDWKERQHNCAIEYNQKTTGEHRKVPDLVAQVTVDQVKEKFGSLRFYYTGGDDYIRGLSTMAESMSEVTCEECGKPGKSSGGGWITVRCDEHAQ